MTHARASAAALLLLAVAPTALAQLTAPTTGGSPAALNGSPQNRPTATWQQWQPKPSYAVNDLPDQYMGANRVGPDSEDQTGFNTCTRGEGSWNQQSRCQTAWVNSLDDFCVWGPPEPGTVGATERQAVAYCTKPTHGTRLIPDGTITSAHFVQTSEYVQVTGRGDFTSIGIPLGDDGGEMDSAGADDLSNPIGGVVYTTAQPSANGRPVMAREWTNFMSWNQFCFRVCFGNNAERHCEHIYDILGCQWNLPANYGDGFDSCDGDLAAFQGHYPQPGGGTSTFKQGDAVTPSPHPAPSSSNCRPGASVNNGGLVVATPLNAVNNNPPAGSAPTGTGSSATGLQTSRSPQATGATNGNAGINTNSNTNSNNGGGSSAAAPKAIASSFAATGIAGIVGAFMALGFAFAA